MSYLISIEYLDGETDVYKKTFGSKKTADKFAEHWNQTHQKSEAQVKKMGGGY